MTISLLGHDKTAVSQSWVLRRLRKMASDGTVLTWRVAEDRSRYEGQRPEELDHRRLTDAYGGQSEPRRRRASVSADWQSSSELPIPYADTCRLGEPACSRSAPPASTNAVDRRVEWCARRGKHQLSSRVHHWLKTLDTLHNVTLWYVVLTAVCRRGWHWQ